VSAGLQEQPFLATAYLPSSAVGAASISLPPVSQFLSSLSFAIARDTRVIDALPDLDSLALLLFARTSSVSRVRLNGRLLESIDPAVVWSAIGSSGFSATTVNLGSANRSAIIVVDHDSVLASFAAFIIAAPQNATASSSAPIAWALSAGQRYLHRFFPFSTSVSGAPLSRSECLAALNASAAAQTLSESTGNGIDDDCDLLVDEELDDGIDNDGDGRIDEDRATSAPSVVFPSNVVFTDCSILQDSSFPSGQPSVVSIDPLCLSRSTTQSPLSAAVNISYTDVFSPPTANYAQCPAWTSVSRTWAVSDFCGNVVRRTQLLTPSPLRILDTSLPTGLVVVNEDEAFSATAVIQSGVLPAAWSLSVSPPSVAFLSGIAIDGNTGALSWPRAAAVGSVSSFQVSVRLSNNGLAVAMKNFTLSVRLRPIINASALSVVAIPAFVAAQIPVPLTVGSTPLVWTLVSAPANVTISSSGIVLWSAPILLGSPHTISVQVSNAAGSSTHSFLLVVGDPPVIDRAPLPISLSANISAQVPWSLDAFRIVSGTLPVTWRLSSPPAGLSINASSGALFWTSPAPADGSPVFINVSVANDAYFDSVRLTVRVFDLPQIDVFSLPSGDDAFLAHGDPFLWRPSLQRGTGSLKWSLLSHPSGMTVDASSGMISWGSASVLAPTLANGTIPITVLVQNEVGSDRVTFLVRVLVKPRIALSSLPVGLSVVVRNGTSLQILPALDAGTGVMTWSAAVSLDGHALIPEAIVLSVNSTSGAVSIAPLLSSSLADEVSVYFLSIEVRNPVGIDSANISIAVHDSPVIVTAHRALDLVIEQQEPWSFQLALQLGTPVVLWSLTMPPSGVAINSSTGLLSWMTPLANDAPYYINVSASNAVGIDRVSIRVLVIFAPVISQALLTSLAVSTAVSNDPSSLFGSLVPAIALANGTTFSFPASLDEGTLPLTWSLLHAPLGMTIHPATGVVSWASGSVQNETVTVAATNAVGRDTLTFVLLVMHPPVVDQSTVPNATVFLLQGRLWTLQVGLALGTGPLSWTLVDQPAGTAGISLSQTSGLLSWLNPAIVPSVQSAPGGVLRIRVSNYVGSADVVVQLVVQAPPNLYRLGLPENATMLVEGQPFTLQVVLSSGSLPVTWDLSRGGPDILIGSSSGLLRWPNPLATQSPKVVTIRVSNMVGTDEVTLVLRVGQLPQFSAGRANLTIPAGDSVVYHPVLIRGNVNTRWYLEGSVQSGMVVDADNGTFSWGLALLQGAPHSIAIVVENELGVARLPLLLRVVTPPVITGVPVAPVLLVQNASWTLLPGLAADVGDDIRWSLVNSTSVPSGFSIDALTGRMSWIAAVPVGAYEITVQARSSVGSDVKVISFQVVSRPSVSVGSADTIGGRQFYFAVGLNAVDGDADGGQIQLSIASADNYAASGESFPIYVNVSAASFGVHTQVVLTGPNDVRVVDLPAELRVDVGVSQKAVHVSASGAIVVVVDDVKDAMVAFGGFASREAFTVFPLEALGLRYRVLSAPYATVSTVSDSRSQFLVVATEDDTQVTVTAGLSDLLVAGAAVPVGSSRLVQLNRFDVLSVRALFQSPGDTTGALVQSTAPVAVISGHGCAAMNSSATHCEKIEQQVRVVFFACWCCCVETATMWGSSPDLC
jgi:hypothetical protein